MNREHKKFLARALMPAACLVFAISTLAMAFRFEPFYSGYYSFAWWSYILFIEAFLYYCGAPQARLFRNPGEFLLLLPLSVTVWLVFEALNFRLSDWHYVDVPIETAVRWTGYPIAYSTVLPGIFSTTAMLDFLGILKNSKTTPLKKPERLYKPFAVIGVLFLVLPLIWPETFFPLVWGAFIFLLEPVNHRAGAPSLLREWEKGSLRSFYLLLLAGLICGMLWEFWNYWAGSKWIYTVPHVGFLKVFEMPLFGFLGFPPFAVECFALTVGFFLLISKIGQVFPADRARAMYVALAVLMVLFDLAVFAGIDNYTVVSFHEFSFIRFGARP